MKPSSAGTQAADSLFHRLFTAAAVACFGRGMPTPDTVAAARFFRSVDC